MPQDSARRLSLWNLVGDAGMGKEAKEVSRSSGGAAAKGCQSFEGRKGLRFQAGLVL